MILRIGFRVMICLPLKNERNVQKSDLLSQVAFLYDGVMLFFPEQGTGHVLIKQHGQDADHDTLDDVQWYHAQQGQLVYGVDDGIDGGTHGDDGVQGQLKEPGELGDQIDGVEQAAEDCHAERTQDKTHQSGLFTLVQMIDDHGGQNQGGAHHEVGQVAHEGGGGALEQELQQHLQSQTDHACTGSQEEAAQQNGDLGEVQLIEGGSQEGNREIQHIEDHGNGTAHADDTHPSGRGHLTVLQKEPLRQLRQQDHTRRNDHADGEEPQIVMDLTENFAHKNHLKNKNCALRKTLRAQIQFSILFHPDSTVGIGISPIQPFGLRTVPPVGNHTLP